MLKYILATLFFAVVVLEYQFGIVLIELFTFHVFHNISIYISLFILSMFIKLFWINRDRLTSKHIQKELVKLVSNASLRETQKLMKLMIETDYKNDKQVHVLRDNIIMICLERMLLYDLVLPDRRKNARFEKVKKDSIKFIQDYRGTK